MSENAIGYIRVSKEEQATEGVSLDAQDARIRAYAALRGLCLVEMIREEGVSAKIPLRERPSGKLLVQALKTGKATHVLCVKLDRLFRNANEALTESDQWNKSKVSLHIIDMGGQAVDTASAMGKLFFTMLAAMAEMERNLISERTTAALNHMRLNDLAYNHTPFGKTRVGDKFVDNVDEQVTILLILKLRAEGWGYERIAKNLNKHHKKTSKGGKWYAKTVYNVVKMQEKDKVA